MRRDPAPLQQLALQEETSSNSYIQARLDAIDHANCMMEVIGSGFMTVGQLLAEQSELLQRIDANTEDIEANIQSAQRELTKYWNRQKGNKRLVAKCFGVLILSFPIWVLVNA
jgi:syntaxin 5